MVSESGWVVSQVLNKLLAAREFFDPRSNGCLFKFLQPARLSVAGTQGLVSGD